MLTFLELSYMFDYRLGCGERHNCKGKHNVAEKTTQKKLRAKIKSKYWKIHRSLTCAKKRYPTKYCKGSQNEENAFLEMHGIHGAANSGVTLFFPLMFEGFFSFPTHSVFHFRLPPPFQHKCVYGQVSTYTDKCPPSTSQV